jgi:hypothetical protein
MLTTSSVGPGCRPIVLAARACPRRVDFFGIGDLIQENCQKNCRDGAGKDVDID